MKIIKLFGVLSLIGLIGCASADADLEEARYILGKGGNPAKAIALASGYLNDADPNIKYEAVSITAGAKVQQAGFDSILIISKLVHKDADAEFEEVLAPSLSNLSANAKALVREAEVLLREVVGSVASEIQSPTGATVAADADFSNVSARLQSNLKFQLGLVRLMEGMRLSLVESGFSSVDEGETLDAADCAESLASAENGETSANQAARYLENSRKEFEAEEVNIENREKSLVNLIDEFQVQFDDDRNGEVDAIDDICAALT